MLTIIIVILSMKQAAAERDHLSRRHKRNDARTRLRAMIGAVAAGHGEGQKNDAKEMYFRFQPPRTPTPPVPVC